ncbi:hypothetical protein SMICM17S_04798 [Streptomyces microflavus]
MNDPDDPDSAAVAASTVRDPTAATVDAETVCFSVSLTLLRGLLVLHSAFCGVVSAQAGISTMRSRAAQSPPYAPLNVE